MQEYFKIQMTSPKSRKFWRIFFFGKRHLCEIVYYVWKARVFLNGELGLTNQKRKKLGSHRQDGISDLTFPSFVSSELPSSYILSFPVPFHAFRPSHTLRWCTSAMGRYILWCIKTACDTLRRIFQHVGNFSPDFGILSAFVYCPLFKWISAKWLAFHITADNENTPSPLRDLRW